MTLCEYFEWYPMDCKPFANGRVSGGVDLQGEGAMSPTDPPRRNPNGPTSRNLLAT
jgi:hypothetical protein